MEQIFERLLWQSRYVMLIAVITSFVAALVVILANMIAMKDLFAMLLAMFTDSASKGIKLTMMVKVIELLDGFLVAGVLMIFAFGLYELYISPLEPARASPQKGMILNIGDIDTLKSKLGKVIVMILIVKALSHAIVVEVSKPMDLLVFAAAITLVSTAFFLTKDKLKKSVT